MKVLKFGGTSVANSENIKKVKSILEKETTKTQIVIVSALGGITDMMLSTANLAKLKDESYKESFKIIEKRHLDTILELIPVQKQSSILSEVKQKLNQLETLFEGIYLLSEISPKTSDKILSYGELLSSYIISEFLKSQNLNCEFKDSRELIVTNSNYTKAIVDFEITNKNVKEYFLKQNKSKIVLLPGFISSNKNGNTTTLGRGGSDYTAAIYAGILNSEILEIWTDVSGMFTSNPKIVSNAQVISEISYIEAMELSHFGAKVLYPPTILPVLNKNIPILIKNTFSPEDKGTLIIKNPKENSQIIRGISHIENIALLCLEGGGMIGISGVAKKLFSVLSKEEINVILITQASSEHSICFGILENQAEKAKKAIDLYFEFEINQGKINPCVIEKDLSIIALVGDNMKNHQGLSGKMFSTLGNNNVNIRAIAQGASEKNISAVINTSDAKKAINSLHERFFENTGKQLNLFITGIGNVGQKFIEQINKQTQYLKDVLKLNIRVAGISNSKKMIFDENGIDLNNYKNILNSGEVANYNKFFEKVKSLNLRNSIFVDNTANYEISTIYEKYLRNNIAVVTCNKIACSSSFENYSKLKQISQEFLVPFLFETNVGAGLPIIDTLKNLIASGDSIQEIQAVLSGSLNFIFNNYNDSNSFHDVVLQAKIEGYTEPDPKIDLSGVDVMRKILILARESGYKLDIEEIENKSFLPKECLNTKTVEDFMKSLITYETHFKDLYLKAKEKGSKLKYVASFKSGKAQVGIQEIPNSHPFYHLEGKDNIVLFYTDRYLDQPLIIKGAGAGADVTASGIFADVIRVGRI